MDLHACALLAGCILASVFLTAASFSLATRWKKEVKHDVRASHTADDDRPLSEAEILEGRLALVEAAWNNPEVREWVSRGDEGHGESHGTSSRARCAAYKGIAPCHPCKSANTSQAKSALNPVGSNVAPVVFRSDWTGKGVCRDTGIFRRSPPTERHDCDQQDLRLAALKMQISSMQQALEDVQAKLRDMDEDRAKKEATRRDNGGNGPFKRVDSAETCQSQSHGQTAPHRLVHTKHCWSHIQYADLKLPVALLLPTIDELETDLRD